MRQQVTAKRLQLPSIRPVHNADVQDQPRAGEGSPTARSDAGCANPERRRGRSRLLPRTYFLEQARREQLRALRLKSHVSLVILSIEGRTRSALVELYRLARVVEGLIRETDVIGWWEEGAIGVLLADTDEAGAFDAVRRIMQRAECTRVSVRVLAYPEIAVKVAQAPTLEGEDLTPAVVADAPRHSRAAIAVKRGIDIVGASLALVALSPLMIATALAVKATSKGPIIFRQIRLGHGGVPFVFYKFRSMRVDAEDTIHRSYVQSFIKQGPKAVIKGDQTEPLFKIKDDPRVTRVGAFIRRFSIDELPQLYNVLKGDMSLVGPRPPLPYEVEAYSPWHLRRILEIKPGITGLWQVEGRSQVAFDDMVRLDLRYAQHWSLLLDIKILLKTVKVVLQGRGSV